MNQASMKISKFSNGPLVSALKDITKGMYSDMAKSNMNDTPSIRVLAKESGYMIKLPLI